MLTEKLESEADDCLRALAGLDTYDVNLGSHPKAWEALEVFARAIEALVRAECVPPGFVVVPVVATSEMRAAAHDAIKTYGVTKYPDASLSWDAMLAAAPGITTPTAKDKP